MDLPHDISKLHSQGYYQLDNCLSEQDIYTLGREFGALDSNERVLDLAVGLPPKIKSKMLTIASHFLNRPARLVRAIRFNKTEHRNWSVRWHQDKTIAVSNKCDIPGWGPWSVKAGIDHVQPAYPILENMLSLRIHLDDASIQNGALKVLPGSHKHALLSADQISQMSKRIEAKTCEAPAGSVLVMKPLLVHSSGKSVHAVPRRVLHLEFSAVDLPEGITWAH